MFSKSRFFVLSSLILASAILTMTYFTAYRFYLGTEQQRATDRAEFYKATLIAALEQYQYFPYVLANDPFVLEAITSQNIDALNKRLESFSQQSNVDAIYLMDKNGLTIAASNWNKPVTYIGRNYSFRPYFQQALKGRRGELFAIGATTLLPGYFIAEPVRDKTGTVQGVIALKVELEPLIKSWQTGGERIFVANPDGIIVLSSVDDWTFKSLDNLSAERRQELLAIRQFADEPLSRLEMVAVADRLVQVGEDVFIDQYLPVGWLDWRLHYLTSVHDVSVKSWTAVLFVFIPMMVLSALYLLFRSQRFRRALRVSQEERRELFALNKELNREIEERRAAERRLERAQKDLKQASKMAALGQLAASVSHELGQPISAMQNYLASAELPGSQLDDDTRFMISRLNRITERMEHITAQLKFFAKPTEHPLQVFDMNEVIGNTLEMVSPDLTVAGVAVSLDLDPQGLPVYGDPLRIEQVLVNLMRNGKDAMQMSEGKRLAITSRADDTHVSVSVKDNGQGLAPGVEKQAFDPFFTTKASGQGMGLGLAISASILSDHDGTLFAYNSDEGGAVFELMVPLYDPDHLGETEK